MQISPEASHLLCGQAATNQQNPQVGLNDNSYNQDAPCLNNNSYEASGAPMTPSHQCNNTQGGMNSAGDNSAAVTSQASSGASADGGTAGNHALNWATTQRAALLAAAMNQYPYAENMSNMAAAAAMAAASGVQMVDLNTTIPGGEYNANSSSSNFDTASVTGTNVDATAFKPSPQMSNYGGSCAASELGDSMNAGAYTNNSQGGHGGQVGYGGNQYSGNDPYGNYGASSDIHSSPSGYGDFGDPNMGG